MIDLVWVLLVVLLVIAGMRVVLRVRGGADGPVRELTDEEIRRLERGGSIEIDAPIDLGEVAEAEERFWGESWDEPDEPFY